MDEYDELEEVIEESNETLKSLTPSKTIAKDCRPSLNLTQPVPKTSDFKEEFTKESLTPKTE
jgi:hypothetical protein